MDYIFKVKTSYSESNDSAFYHRQPFSMVDNCFELLRSNLIRHFSEFEKVAFKLKWLHESDFITIINNEDLLIFIELGGKTIFVSRTEERELEQNNSSEVAVSSLSLTETSEPRSDSHVPTSPKNKEPENESNEAPQNEKSQPRRSTLFPFMDFTKCNDDEYCFWKENQPNDTWIPVIADDEKAQPNDLQIKHAYLDIEDSVEINEGTKPCYQIATNKSQTIRHSNPFAPRNNKKASKSIVAEKSHPNKSASFGNDWYSKNVWESNGAFSQPTTDIQAQTNPNSFAGYGYIRESISENSVFQLNSYSTSNTYLDEQGIIGRNVSNSEDNETTYISAEAASYQATSASLEGDSQPLHPTSDDNVVESGDGNVFQKRSRRSYLRRALRKIGLACNEPAHVYDWNEQENTYSGDEDMHVVCRKCRDSSLNADLADVRESARNRNLTLQVENVVYHTNPLINEALITMTGMGYLNTNGNLIRLLESVNGNIAKALDEICKKRTEPYF